MRIVRGLESYPPEGAAERGRPRRLRRRSPRPSRDPRHRGGASRSGGLGAVACTFDRHPMEVLQPDRAPLPITTLDERLELIGETGVDATVVLRFTRELAAIEPEAFVKDVLLERLARAGDRGRLQPPVRPGARGDAQLLESLGRDFGFRAHIVRAMTVDGVAGLVHGDPRGAAARRRPRAARLLGRPYAIAGEVVAARGEAGRWAFRRRTSSPIALCSWPGGSTRAGTIEGGRIPPSSTSGCGPPSARTTWRSRLIFSTSPAICTVSGPPEFLDAPARREAVPERRRARRRRSPATSPPRSGSDPFALLRDGRVVPRAVSADKTKVF